MPHGDSRRSGWQGVSLVAITYVYFLIFAQFAFLHRLADLGIAGAHLKFVMAAMAGGGILFSLLVPRLQLWPSPNLRLRIALCACSVAAFLTILSLGPLASMCVSFLIGAGLGLLTVTLVTHLRQWIGDWNPLFNVGLGTGIGYFVCNFPPLFTASPQIQAATSGILCLAGTCIPLQSSVGPESETAHHSSLPLFSFPRVLVCFAALVWLDSAAFFIIQNAPALKAGTWQGSTHLWTNGLLHLLAALASAWFLHRRGLSFVLSGAVIALGVGCLLLLSPDRVWLASLFYPIGVSLYSVALVAYPALLAPASSAAVRGRQAGWIYAIAGWVGSAMGIGMGQNLGHVPPAFVLVAGAVVLLPWHHKVLQERKRELALTAAFLLAALCIDRLLVVGDAPQPLSQVERGRQVYISEGCISCHSQYVRPNTADVLLWGPAQTMEELRRERPPLIGNRRQGPDLAEVGGRRSPQWLKAHFDDPPEVSGSSIMPSYGFLFGDGRGDDLVAYLASLKGAGTEQHLAAEKAWHLSAAAVAAANAHDGERIFQRHCATCHAAGGRTRWRMSFKRIPPDLTVGPYLDISLSVASAQQMDRLAHIAKFGISGTDMPGHEYLSDEEIASLSLRLTQIIAHPTRNK
ncbi:MAG: cbb3-type cytochrome c oxidase subunit II [Terracidiphilus sp.]|nr:cbb3-type cytochrome c oxidase subunit II [Terracidiphilus sp.]MDR3775866.1 cbb3-type cytochrome c oxidase subunit II [Terracidiphilus sp.]